MSWNPSLEVATVALLFASSAVAEPRLKPADRVRLEEAFSILESLQDRIWPRWSGAPSSVVLVDGELEYLLRSTETPDGFEPLPGGPVLFRKRVFPPTFLATFPAFGPTPVIVVGTAEATGKTSTSWVLTLLHEHFHQLQYSDPGYYEETKALDLSGGDETGMWMLNYAFPYESKSEEFASLARELAALVESPTLATPAAREAFWRRYDAFGRSLEPKDYRYLSLQLWQEGISRYVELKAAELAAAEHRASPEFEALDDYETFAHAADALKRKTLEELRTSTLASEKREVFYAFGAVLGLLLDQEGIDWRARYLSEKFYLERYRPSGAR